MKKVVIPYPANETIASKICEGLNASLGKVEIKHFPDGESYVRLQCDVYDADVIVVASLFKPDDKVLPLIFLLRLLRDAKAAKIILVASYLPYMRQDKQFKPGEAVTSTYFGELLSSFIDELITVDPHLHRRHAMFELYKAPSKVIHASTSIACWMKDNLKDIFVVGPDIESEQWVSDIANQVDCPYTILNKERHGDRDVRITFPELEKYKSYLPVLVDDIISTAHTMIVTATHLIELGFKPPVCIGVHAIFSGNALTDLQKTCVERIVTCNTIPHETNEIDLSPLIIKALKDD